MSTAPQPLRVLAVSHSSGLMGAERSLLDLVTGLPEHGIEADVALPTRGPLQDRLAEAGLRSHVTGHDSWCHTRTWLPTRLTSFWYAPVRRVRNGSATRHLRRLLANQPFDLVYSNSLVVPTGAYAARGAGVPHVWHVRELVEGGLGLRFDVGRARAMQLLSEASDRIVCNSRAILEATVPSAARDRATVVYNGPLDDDWTRSAPATPRVADDGAPRLGIVGAVAPHKGLEDAIRALGVLHGRGIAARLHVVGDGRPAYLRELKTLAGKLSIRDAVHWRGRVDGNMQSVYSSLDVVVVCTRFEAFGRVAVEAMAMGRPVVGAAAGGLPEIVTHGETGLLYEPGNVDQLADRIAELLGDPDRRRTIADRGRADVLERFGRDRYVAEMAALFRQVVERPAT